MSAPPTTVCTSPDDHTPPQPPAAAAATPAAGETYEVDLPLDTLVPAADRVVPTPEADKQLIDSVKAVGLQSSLEVAADRVTLLNGCRRRRLMMLAGFTHARCRVHVDVKTKRDADRASLAFDIQQKKTPLEQGLRFQRHVAETGDNQTLTADYFGCCQATVTRGLRAAGQSPEIQAALAAKTLSAEHLNSVAGVKSNARREKLLHKAAAEALTAGELAKLAGGRKPKAPKAAGEPMAEWEYAGMKLAWPRAWLAPQVRAAAADFIDFVQQHFKGESAKSFVSVAEMLERKGGQ